jgi:hypothetical protein
MQYLKPAFFATALILAASTAAADDSFRCGQHLIGVGDARDKVLEYCGEPTSREGWTWIYQKEERLSVQIHFEADGTVGRIEEGDGL